MAYRQIQPSFVEYGDGYVLPKGFDNERAIQDTGSWRQVFSCLILFDIILVVKAQQG